MTGLWGGCLGTPSVWVRGACEQGLCEERLGPDLRSIWPVLGASVRSSGELREVVRGEALPVPQY